MSLGLRAGSKLHGVLGFLTPYGAGKLKELVEHARAYARHHRLDAAFRSVPTPQGWRISFHPAAQDIVLTLDGGYAVIDARTLEAGPGYHAFVTGFIDYLSRHHKWVWEWRNPARHLGDDTGYYRDRNFAALQTLMAGEFAAMCQGLVETESNGTTPMTVWLPAEVCLAGDPFAATSLGFRDRAFFEAPNPERFFPWWQQGLTAQTARNLALSRMWLDVQWDPPADARERKDLENTRVLIERARTLGATFADDEGADEIDALLRDETLDIFAPSIGYGRQDTWYMDTGEWSVALPSGFREEIDADGQLCSMLTDTRAVYMRSYAYEKAKVQLEWPEPISPDYGEYLRFKTEDYWVLVQSGEMETDEDGVRWWIWQGIYNACEGSLLINVVSSDENDAAWAEKVLRSVQAPGDSATNLPPPVPASARRREL